MCPGLITFIDFPSYTISLVSIHQNHVFIDHYPLWVEWLKYQRLDSSFIALFLLKTQAEDWGSLIIDSTTLFNVSNLQIRQSGKLSQKH